MRYFQTGIKPVEIWLETPIKYLMISYADYCGCLFVGISEFHITNFEQNKCSLAAFVYFNQLALTPKACI